MYGRRNVPSGKMCGAADRLRTHKVSQAWADDYRMLADVKLRLQASQLKGSWQLSSSPQINFTVKAENCVSDLHMKQHEQISRLLHLVLLFQMETFLELLVRGELTFVLSLRCMLSKLKGPSSIGPRMVQLERYCSGHPPLCVNFFYLECLKELKSPLILLENGLSGNLSFYWLARLLFEKKSTKMLGNPLWDAKPSC